MALFKRKPAPRAGGLPTFNNEVRPFPITVVDTDWRDTANILREWRIDSAELDHDLLAWRNGMRMGQLDEEPGQRFNEAEYMTRGLKHALTSECPLSDEEQIASIVLLLALLVTVPARIVDMNGNLGLLHVQLTAVVVVMLLVRRPRRRDTAAS